MLTTFFGGEQANRFIRLEYRLNLLFGLNVTESPSACLPDIVEKQTPNTSKPCVYIYIYVYDTYLSAV